MKEFDDLRAILDGCEEDLGKFGRGNKAAGTRLRKVMQDVKKQAQVVREAILSAREAADEA